MVKLTKRSCLYDDDPVECFNDLGKLWALVGDLIWSKDPSQLPGSSGNMRRAEINSLSSCQNCPSDVTRLWPQEWFMSTNQGNLFAKQPRLFIGQWLRCTPNYVIAPRGRLILHLICSSWINFVESILWALGTFNLADLFSWVWHLHLSSVWHLESWRGRHENIRFIQTMKNCAQSIWIDWCNFCSSDRT